MGQRRRHADLVRRHAGPGRPQPRRSARLFPVFGFQSASLYAAGSHQLSARWSTVATLGVSTVLGDARDSPLVERDSNVFGSVGMVYAF